MAFSTWLLFGSFAWCVCRQPDGQYYVGVSFCSTLLTRSLRMENAKQQNSNGSTVEWPHGDCSQLSKLWVRSCLTDTRSSLLWNYWRVLPDVFASVVPPPVGLYIIYSEEANFGKTVGTISTWPLRGSLVWKLAHAVAKLLGFRPQKKSITTCGLLNVARVPGSGGPCNDYNLAQDGTNTEPKTQSVQNLKI